VKVWLSWTLFGLAALILLLTVVNASWLASPPKGAIRLIAHRGVAQQFDRAGVKNDSCTASRIEPPVHDYLENSTRSMEAAKRLGADFVEIDIAPTADGQIAVFHDWTLECRTEASGKVRRKTLAELKALDIGHGYTADGAKSHPLRGHGRGACRQWRKRSPPCRKRQSCSTSRATTRARPTCSRRS
jgi:glycerophosphoryl diester phosphodiesterase